MADAGRRPPSRRFLSVPPGSPRISVTTAGGRVWGACEQGIYKARVESVVRVRQARGAGSEDEWVRPDVRGLA